MENFDAFTVGLVDDYWSARSLAIPHPKMSRGTARVVSSVVEERLGAAILHAYPGIDNIYVDQGVRIAGADMGLRKPDVCIVRNGMITLALDLKMDMNYIRRDKLPKMVRANREWLDASSGKEAILSVRNSEHSGQKKRLKVGLIVSPRCVFSIIIVSGMGIKKSDFQKQLEACGDDPHTPVLVLWPDAHPNNQNYPSRDAAAADLANLKNPAAVDRLNELCAEAAR